LHTSAPTCLTLPIELSILVLKELIGCFLETFIASKTSTTKLGFLFRKQTEVGGGQDSRIWGWEEFQSRSQLHQPSQLGMCELVHCHAGAERIELVCPSFKRDFLTQTSQFVCIVRTVYGTILLKIVNQYYQLTIPKKLKPSSSLLMAPS
jgi:hypothetical protein